MEVRNSKSVPSLSHQAAQFLLKYTHHIVWRRLNPPRRQRDGKLRVTNIPIPCRLPELREPQTDPRQFRADLNQIREYFSSIIVRPVHDHLAEQCAKFVAENKLPYGDLLLQLIFQDKKSKVLSIKSLDIILRKWSLREMRTLHRTLVGSSYLVKIALPHKATERILMIIGKHCPMLEDLDVSFSYISNTGILALGGVTVTTISDDAQNANENGNVNIWRSHNNMIVDRTHHEESEHGTMKYPDILDILKGENPRLPQQMRPFIDKRINPNYRRTWKHSHKLQYSFNKRGCRNLKALNIYKSKNHPTRTRNLKK